MTRISTVFLVCALMMAFVPADTKRYILDRKEAQNAFEYLNKFRQDPGEYGSKIKLHLGRVVVRPALTWDTILARVAEEKAMDMAKNNYFAHINKQGEGINIMISRAGYRVPEFALRNKKNNWYESIAWASGNKQFVVNGQTQINQLITDSDVPTLGHRKHLLGIDEDTKNPFNSRLTDIGIGYATIINKDSTYKSYMSVIIACHN